MPKRTERERWLSDMLDLQESLDETIRNMITYKMIAGPWDDRDVNDGWRVLRGLLKRAENKWNPKRIALLKKLGPKDEAEYCTCGQKACVCWHDEK
jgi:hypothetical protein